MLLKSPSAEPLFAPAFLAALARREPRLAGALAAATWPGGDAQLEAPVLEGVGTVLAYGEQAALDDLERRAPGKVVGYGPRTSLAVVAASADLRAAAEGLARDVALFDQRGCLSVVAVYTDGDAEALAERLASELLDMARIWPPGPAAKPVSAAVQHVRFEAEMRGLRQFTLSVREGTVIVDPRPELRPSPGLRTVRVHPLEDLARLPGILAPWRGRLQGAALAGEEAWELEPRLVELGISRRAAPGELQSPDATWHNGGIDPLEALDGAMKRRAGLFPLAAGAVRILSRATSGVAQVGDPSGLLAVDVDDAGGHGVDADLLGLRVLETRGEAVVLELDPGVPHLVLDLEERRHVLPAVGHQEPKKPARSPASSRFLRSATAAAFGRVAHGAADVFGEIGLEIGVLPQAQEGGLGTRLTLLLLRR